MMKKLGIFVVFFISIASIFAACQNTQETEKSNDTLNKTCFPVVKNNGKNPVVTFEMENGKKIKAELYPEIAPNTVANFISLIKKGYYDGVSFHRVVKGFVIQGGDPQGTGTGGPGYGIKGEFDSNGCPNELKHEEGVLSMARSSAPDSAGSQFFIVTGNAQHLDGEYAGFGQVIEGLDVVKEIENTPTNQSRPVNAVIMKKVTVETFDVQYPEPEKV